MNIFLAGAGGVIGRRLMPLLRDAGHAVTGTTRSATRAAAIETLGARAVVVDVFDAAALDAAMRDAMPEVVIHQLTDLPDEWDPDAAAAVLERNARLRIEGTRHLVAAARAAGAGRMIAQSICFWYQPKDSSKGPHPFVETDPLMREPDGALTTTSKGIASLEQQVTGAPGLDGIVLRYGKLYGAGTWSGDMPADAPLHVDAAAHAAFLAVTHGAPGIYNVAEDDGVVSSEKARRELGIDTAFRLRD